MDTVSVDEAEPPAERLTDVGLTDGVGPGGETDVLRFTVPEKPFRLFKVTVVVPEAPWSTVREVGLGVIVKSGPDDVWLWTTKLPYIEVGWIVQ